MSDTVHRLLPNWKIADPSEVEEIQGTAWSDHTGLTIRRGLCGIYDVSFPTGISFRVNTLTKLIQIFNSGVRARIEVDHLLLDQIVPRVVAHQGELTIHGAGILVNEKLIVIIGKSGQGKSTITSWFVSEGYAIVGDDAVVIALNDGVNGFGIGPKLRLNRDVAKFMSARISEKPLDAGYANKVKFDLAFAEDLSAPIAAIFKLSEPESGIRLERNSPSSACMALVEESFALDPMDLERAGARLRAAAQVAERVPFYDLAYPRRFEALDDVCRMMVGAI